MSKPILFRGPMVRAILDNRKTQTRRVAKWPAAPQTDVDDDGWPLFEDDMGDFQREKSPYEVGDVLWVRETWRVHAWCDEPKVRIQYAAGGYQQFSGEQLPDSSEDWAWSHVGGDPYGDCHWRPSIFMPRWASRIELEVTGVRCERVQEIHPADVAAEGLVNPTVRSFGELWDSINGKKAPWSSNPSVWVYEFKRVKP